MADVLALVDDLFFQAKLVETARQVGIVLQTVGTGEALLSAATAARGATDGPRLLLVDLNARAGALQAIETLHAEGNQLPIIAFLSHVQVELAERARVAGCQQVMARSQFTSQLAAILRQAKA
jgi:CheY-like chemotaxis protein